MVLVRLNDKGKWDIVNKEDKQDGDFYLDGKFKNKLDFALREKEHDNDPHIIIDGMEGVGKSSKGGNVARYMSYDTFDPLKDIIDDPDDFMDKLEKCENGKVFLVDEGYPIFASTDFMVRKQKDAIKVLTICRQKNITLIICCPSFFNLNKYIAVERTVMLVHCYKKRGERGFFSYFGYKSKRILFSIGKRNFNSYDQPKSRLRGRFTKCSLLENDDYKKAKLRVLNKTFNNAKEIKPKTPKKIKLERDDEIIIMNAHKPAELVAGILGKSVRRINQRKEELREKIAIVLAENKRNSLENDGNLAVPGYQY